MYKLLLCWRYLLTRYLALVCIVSVMLGVATLIVVNSVMAGFSTKLRDRLHGTLSDVVVEAYDFNGMSDVEGKMKLIRSDPYLNDEIADMTPTLEIFAMLQYTINGSPVMRPVHLVGLQPEGKSKVGGFEEFLVEHKDHARQAFDLNPTALKRYEHNRDLRARFMPREQQPEIGPDGKPAPSEPPSSIEDRPETIVLGRAMCFYRDRKSADHLQLEEIQAIHLGDEVVITTLNGEKMRPVNDRLLVSDYYLSGMSDYDSSFVFVPLEYIQHLRTMPGRATSIQISLKNYDHARPVVERLNEVLAKGEPLSVQTWEQKQGALLSAIDIERGILNILLFMIILVAGFGILAIFSMIVVEKTRDIGILKALGASNGGVMKIFLSYGLLLGSVGSVVGSILGVTFTIYINEIEWALSKVTGHAIFDRSTYYFDKIPTDIEPTSVLLVNVGAILIAVMFSVLPALRAATLHPVRALRYE